MIFGEVLLPLDIFGMALLGCALVVARAAQQRGLIVRPLGNMAILSPPLILGSAEIGEIAAILRDSIATVSGDLRREDLF